MRRRRVYLKARRIRNPGPIYLVMPNPLALYPWLMLAVAIASARSVQTTGEAEPASSSTGSTAYDPGLVPEPRQLVDQSGGRR